MGALSWRGNRRCADPCRMLVQDKHAVAGAYRKLVRRRVARRGPDVRRLVRRQVDINTCKVSQIKLI